MGITNPKVLDAFNLCSCKVIFLAKNRHYRQTYKIYVFANNRILTHKKHSENQEPQKYLETYKPRNPGTQESKKQFVMGNMKLRCTQVVLLVDNKYHEPKCTRCIQFLCAKITFLAENGHFQETYKTYFQLKTGFGHPMSDPPNPLMLKPIYPSPLPLRGPATIPTNLNIQLAPLKKINLSFPRITAFQFERLQDCKIGR